MALGGANFVPSDDGRGGGNEGGGKGSLERGRHRGEVGSARVHETSYTAGASTSQRRNRRRWLSSRPRSWSRWR
jgi:hypothetical protein